MTAGARGRSAGVAALGALADASRCVRASLDRRLALVAQAAHELRGAAQRRAARAARRRRRPAGAPRRLAAVELELRRAGLALDDLHAAPRGRRRPSSPSRSTSARCCAEAAEAWAPAGGRARRRAAVRRAPGGRLLVRADRLRLAQAIGNLVAQRARARSRAGAGPGARDAPARAHRGARPRARACRRRSPRSPRRRTPGAAGHGLAIAARVAARHGGRLVTAPVTAGACLVLELPADAGRQPRRTLAAAGCATSPRRSAGGGRRRLDLAARGRPAAGGRRGLRDLTAGR